MTRKEPQKIYSQYLSDELTDKDEKIREGVFQVLFTVARFIQHKNIETPATITLSIETDHNDQRIVAELDGNMPHEN